MTKARLPRGRVRIGSHPKDLISTIHGTGQKHRILVYNQRRREGVLGGPKLYVQFMFCRPEEDTPSPKRSVKQADRSPFHQRFISHSREGLESIGLALSGVERDLESLVHEPVFQVGVFAERGSCFFLR